LLDLVLAHYFIALGCEIVICLQLLEWEGSDGSAPIFHRVLLVVAPVYKPQPDYVDEVEQSYDQLHQPRYHIED
jgi:hypothetical protein